LKNPAKQDQWFSALQMALSITDENTKHSTTTIIPNDSPHEITLNLDKHWFCSFSFPAEVYFKGGKVEVSQLSHAIGQLTRAAHSNAPKCKSWYKTFNTETEAQWMRNKDLISSEDFVEVINFFHHTSGARPILDADATNQHH
jgi:hypothetical protein